MSASLNFVKNRKKCGHKKAAGVRVPCGFFFGRRRGRGSGGGEVGARHGQDTAEGPAEAVVGFQHQGAEAAAGQGDGEGGDGEAGHVGHEGGAFGHFGTVGVAVEEHESGDEGAAHGGGKS